MAYRILLMSVVAICFSVAVPSVQARTYAYIPSSGDGNVVRISADNQAFTTAAFGDDPYGAAVTPQGDSLVVTRPSADSVTLIRTVNFSTVAAQVNRPVGDEPRGVAIESRGYYAYVANYAADTVSEIYIPSFAVTDTINVGNGPWGVAAIYDEIEGATKVYVANHLDDSISVITDGVVDTIGSVGDGPVGLALSTDGAYLYVALLNDDAVAVIRTRDNALVNTIGAGAGPWGVAVGSDGKYVYVTNSLDDTVTVIDGQSRLFFDTFNVGARPLGVACPRNGDFAYVINQTDNSISKIDIGSQTVAGMGAGQINGAFALGAFIGGSPPSPPSGLTAAENGYNKIDLAWTDNSGDELGFKIERRLETEERFTQINKVDADATTFTDTGLSGGTAYVYRIRAYNEAADSDYSASAGATTDEGKFTWCFIQTLLN